MGQQQSERGGDRRSFRDLAQLAGTPSAKRGSISQIRPKTTANDSGMIDLEALASSDPGAVDRASVTPLASATLFDGDAEEMPTSPRISPVPASVAPAAATHLATPPAMMTPAPRVISAQATLRSSDGAKSSGTFGRLAAVAGLAAIAAGAFFAVRALRPMQAPSATASVVQAVPVVQAAVQAPVVAAAPPVVPAANPGIDPMNLPQSKAIVTTSPIVLTSRASHAAPAAQAPVAPVASPVAKKTPDADVASNVPAKPAAKVAAKDPGPSLLTGALGDAIKQAGASPTPPAPQADAPVAAAAPAPVAQALPTPASAPVAPSNAVSQRPSQGAVTSALGGVLPNARKCLGPDDGVSRAHVVFGSDGNVQSTTVSGFSEGKPSEACIKAALGKAQVPAFAEASYGATVTVRP